jgi:phage baseplate assembly protein W
MLKEIYMRDPSDPLYQTDVLEVSNEIEALLGQIRMLLFTRPGEVISAPNFGIDLEQYIFSTNVSGSRIQKTITDLIYSSIPVASKYEVEVQVGFFVGTTRDICLIDIFVNGTKYLGIAVK